MAKTNSKGLDRIQKKNTSKSIFKDSKLVNKLLLGIIFVSVCFGSNLVVLSSACAHTIEGKKLIHMNEIGFDPVNITLQVGETLVFENEGEEGHWPASDDHPTHLNYSDFDPKAPIPPGQSWEYIFTEPGEYGYHDHLFPQFTGVITVEGEATNVPDSGKTITEYSNQGESFPCKIFNQFFGDSSNDKNMNNNSSDNSELPSTFLNNNDFEIDNDIFEIEFKQPKSATLEQVKKKKKYKCDPGDYGCASKYLRNVVEEYGPSIAVELLHDLLNSKKISLSVDDHQLAHDIGRQTAIDYGANSSAFFLCPTTSDMGCQHGFFELVLGKVGSSTDVAAKICEDVDEKYATGFKFQCFHGVGHGILMATAYDVYSALSVCDSLVDPYDQTGCWQGVFMENVNSQLSGYATVDGVFSDQDPLAPCNNLEPKYQEQCFLNHSGYLMRFYNGDIAQAADACVNEDGSIVYACIISLGTLTSTPSWQVGLAGNTEYDQNVETSLYLCNQFPTQAQVTCYQGALDNIMNYDEKHVEKRALEYCSLVSNWSKLDCYRTIGVNLLRLVASASEREEACNQVPQSYRTYCKSAANV